MLQPRLVVLDEPISALDVSIRAQILNLLARVKADYGAAYLFIAHDLHPVAALADRIDMMYLGEIVETGPAAQVAETPRHPYTHMLFAASATVDAGAASAVGVAPRGEPPSAFRPARGLPLSSPLPARAGSMRGHRAAATPARWPHDRLSLRLTQVDSGITGRRLAGLARHVLRRSRP